MKNTEIKSKIDIITKSLITAETAAKELADAIPAHGAAQSLRGRCLSALELAGHVAATPPVEVAEPKK